MLHGGSVNVPSSNRERHRLISSIDMYRSEPIKQKLLKVLDLVDMYISKCTDEVKALIGFDVVVKWERLLSFQHV